MAAVSEQVAEQHGAEAGADAGLAMRRVAARADLAPRRTFTRRQVVLAWRKQGQVCNLCKRRVPSDLMQGDHIVPWSQGGPTTFSNLQALCGSCNGRKSNKTQEVALKYFEVDLLAAGTYELRRWQADALPEIMGRILQRPVLVEACPGAGKTAFGLEVAYRLLEAGKISRVLVVVPTVGIRNGWLMAASKRSPGTPTLPLEGPEWKATDLIRDDRVGAVFTYQALATMSEAFLAHATDPGHRTLVIFDEVHHASAENTWGGSAVEAFAQDATAVLSLSGTPFRTDKNPIAFVPHRGGSAKPDYRYSYGDAVRDGACRPVQFVTVKGETTFRTER
jgi:superfamily II DNA or RNA helicase